MNSSSWKLGNFSGIGIYIHWTFLIVPAVILWSTLAGGSGIAAAVHSITLIMAIFGCVLLHELGHALMARRFGIGTRDITLLPIGGLARLERMPHQPAQELAVALAGPAVNLVIAASLFVGLTVSGGLALLTAGVAPVRLVAEIMAANVVLVLFNLLPVFPMDGGRVLRALLAMQMPHVRATEIAAGVGQVMAVGFVVVGLFTNWMLALVGLFVFFAARGEVQLAHTKSSEPVQHAPDIDPVQPTDLAARLARHDYRDGVFRHRIIEASVVGNSR